MHSLNVNYNIISMRLYHTYFSFMQNKENNSKIIMNCHRLLAALRSTRASEIHSTHLGLAPPQMSL